MKLVNGVLVGVATTLLLTGCFFSQSNGTATGGGTGGGGQSGQSDGPAVVEESNSGDSDFVGVPSSFPVGEIPLVEGEVPVGVDLGTGWSVIVTVDDIASGFAEASANLKGAGFDTVAETLSAEGSFGVYQTDQYLVNLSASDNPDYGPSVSYVVINQE